MPDPVASGVDELRRAAAAAVSAVPAVVRVEPTLVDALRRLQTLARQPTGPSGRAESAATDGIRLRRHDDLVDIDVDITASTSQPASLTARTVSDIVHAAVTAHQLLPGAITVTVLKLVPTDGSAGR